MTEYTFSRTTAGGAAISIREETGILEMIYVTELLLCVFSCSVRWITCSSDVDWLKIL
jgi:hypothetical protein